MLAGGLTPKYATRHCYRARVRRLVEDWGTHFQPQGWWDQTAPSVTELQFEFAASLTKSNVRVQFRCPACARIVIHWRGDHGRNDAKQTQPEHHNKYFMWNSLFRKLIFIITSTRNRIRKQRTHRSFNCQTLIYWVTPNCFLVWTSYLGLAACRCQFKGNFPHRGKSIDIHIDHTFNSPYGGKST